MDDDEKNGRKRYPLRKPELKIMTVERNSISNNTQAQQSQKGVTKNIKEEGKIITGKEEEGDIY